MRKLKKTKWKYITFLLIAVIVLGVAYFVYQSNSGNKQEPTGQTNKPEPVKAEDIRLPIVNLDTMNPILSTNKNVQDITKLIFEPLLTLTVDYKIQPCLAKEYSKTGDNSYVIKLREDIKWQDGQAFTSRDVLYTIDRLKDTNSIYSSNVQFVKSVQIIDEHSLRIDLEKEVPFFEYNLTFPIVSVHYYEKEDFKSIAKNSSPIGTGMYQITGTGESYITLSLNTNWWNMR